MKTEQETISLITPDILAINKINGEYNNDSYLINNHDYWILKNSYDEIIDSAFSGYVSSFGNIDDGFVDEEKTSNNIFLISR